MARSPVTTESAAVPDDQPAEQPPPVLDSVRGRTILGQVAWLSGPVLVEQSLAYLIGLSDTILTARYLSVEHLAAVTTAAYVVWFVGGLLMVICAGATALVARFIGARQPADARAVANQAMLMAVALGTLIALVGVSGADAIVRLLNLRGDAAAQGASYLRIVLATSPFISARAIGIACLRGSGDTRTGMRVMCVENVVNVLLSWLLVTGTGPFPAIGLPGIALGTAAAEMTGGLLVIGALVRGRGPLRLGREAFPPRPAWISRILRISLPAAAESLTNVVCQLWFLGLINRLGSQATAAHGVALRCEALAFLSLMAFAVAGGTLAGQYLGAGQPALASRSARAAWGCGVGLACVLGVVLSFAAGPMVRLFLRDSEPEVAFQGIRVLKLVAFALPALSTIQVLSGVLRGVGDTRWPWAVVLAGYLLVRLPLTYQLTSPGPFDLGLYGAWVAMFADLHTRALLLTARFLHGGWKRVRV